MSGGLENNDLIQNQMFKWHLWTLSSTCVELIFPIKETGGKGENLGFLTHETGEENCLQCIRKQVFCVLEALQPTKFIRHNLTCDSKLESNCWKSKRVPFVLCFWFILYKNNFVSRSGNVMWNIISIGKMYSKFQTVFQINLCYELDLQIGGLQGQNLS